MDKYEVQWNYVSSLGGPWKSGEVLELTEAEAKALNQDSPGVVVRHVVKPPKTRQVRESKTRQVKRARKTRAVGGSES